MLRQERPLLLWFHAEGMQNVEYRGPKCKDCCVALDTIDLAAGRSVAAGEGVPHGVIFDPWGEVGAVMLGNGREDFGVVLQDL